MVESLESFMNEKVQNPIIRAIFHKINDYRNAIIIVISWIIASELSSRENRLDITVKEVLRFFLYPINLVFFGTNYSDAGFPSIFLILVPFVCVFTFGFLYLISSED